MPPKKQKGDSTSEGTGLPGWPGYRTRPNRSGLDPIDSRTEAGHMGGTFLRRLFTFRARTRNPFYLGAMFVLGVVPFVTTVILIISGLPAGDTSSLAPIIYLAVSLIVSGAVTVNFLLSGLEMLGVIPARRGAQSLQSKRQTHQKKFPKRRKDHR